MKQTIGTRVGFLYDKLADPTFTGKAAEAVMKEYIGLTRHPDDPNLAFFLITPRRQNNFGPVLLVGGYMIIIIMWLRLLRKAIDYNKASHAEAVRIKRRVKEMIDRDFPDIELPEGLFDEVE